MTAIKSLIGSVFNGLHPVALPARLDMADTQATLTTDTMTATFSIAELVITPRIGSAQRLISFPNGRQFACEDNPALDALPQESPSEGLVAWLEARWRVAVGCVGVIAALIVIGYFFGLPIAAKHIVARIPMATEQSLGTEALAWLEANNVMRASELDTDTIANIETEFKRITSALPQKAYYRLEFCNAPLFGPNALAFPGGVIIITDAMVNRTETMDEVIAVLAHEMGHVEMRHTLRSVLQNSAIAAAIATITADAATMTGTVAGLPLVLAQTKYSRDFENEADTFAFNLLKQYGYSPEAFADIMERIAEDESEKKSYFSFLSTHPDTKLRAQRAREAAEE